MVSEHVNWPVLLIIISPAILHMLITVPIRTKWFIAAWNVRDGRLHLRYWRHLALYELDTDVTTVGVAIGDDPMSAFRGSYLLRLSDRGGELRLNQYSDRTWSLSAMRELEAAVAKPKLAETYL